MRIGRHLLLPLFLLLLPLLAGSTPFQIADPPNKEVRGGGVEDQDDEKSEFG